MSADAPATTAADFLTGNPRAVELLAASGAVLSGHFVYTSQRHGPAYVNKDALYPNTKATSELCSFMAASLAKHDVEIIAGPAVGAIILSTWTAHHLDVPGVYIDKTDDGLRLTRGYDQLVAGKRVGVVEDILTTGGSLLEANRAVEAAGGTVVATAALVNRGGIVAADVEAPTLDALVSVDFPSWEADECPLCAQGIPVATNVGKGADFLAGKHG